MIAPADLKMEFLATIPKLRAFATIFCGRTVRADDLTQETLIRARENGGSFRPGSNLVAWCFASERNCDLVLKGHMDFRSALAELPPAAVGPRHHPGVVDYRIDGHPGDDKHGPGFICSKESTFG